MKTFSKKEKRTILFLIGMMAAVILAGLIFNILLSKNAEIFNAGLNFDNGDQKIVWSRYEKTEIELNESVEIKKSGVYHLSGNLENGMVTVDAGDARSKVKLILDNVSINNESGPAIYIKSADDIVIESAEGSENSLSSGEVFESYLKDENVDGTIYSKGDLSFLGSGKILVESKYQDAIVSKDDLVIRSGEIEINSADDGIRGKDSVYVAGGKLKINAKQDGIKSTNDEDGAKGFVCIEDGEVEISAGDDGIHATTQLIIAGGNVNIAKSYEGIEGSKIVINGGEIKIVATDDGINVAGGKDESAFMRPGAEKFVKEEFLVLINNGELSINASGDGIDSNGKIYINGGRLIIDGPISNNDMVLDSNEGIFINGGEVFAVGSGGLAEKPNKNSFSLYSDFYFEKAQPKQTKIEIKDENGEVIFQHTAVKAMKYLFVSSEMFENEHIYYIYTNGEIVSELNFSE